MDTVFSDLPVTIQLKILDNYYSLKKLRLVNKELWQLVIYSQRLQFYITNKSLDTFSRIGQTTPIVGELQFKRITKPLPIWSSTRSNLPRTKCLNLSSGISSENVLKLLRYYVGKCTHLKLTETSLQNVKPYQISSGLQVNYLKTLEIVHPFSNQDHRSDVTLQGQFERNQHWHNLVEIFNKIKFQRLTNVILNWTTCFDIIFTNEFKNLFVRAFFCFLKRHGQQIEAIKIIQNHLNLWPYLIEFWQHFTHLEKLKFQVNVKSEPDDLLIPTDFRNYLNAIKTLKNLKLGIFGVGQEFQVVQYLLEKNSENLKLFHLDTELSFIGHSNMLYQIANPDLKITKLKLSIICDLTKEDLETAFNNDFKLPTVKYLAIDLVTLMNAATRWQENLIKWIIQICPNLRELNLGVLMSRNVEPYLQRQDISTLILGLPKLIKMDLKCFNKCLRNDRERPGNLVSIEAEEWIFNNFPKSYSLVSL